MRIIYNHWTGLVLVLGLTVFAIWGIEKVPFHPDEASWLMMSGDLEVLFSQPLTLGYDPERNDALQELRELNAPLAKYVLGLGRLAFGLSAPLVDWDWGKTWEENEAAGAMPSPEMLFSGRLAVTLLFPLSLWLMYLIGLNLGGHWASLLGVFLLGLNGLMLLHARRAMAEGTLVFGVLFAMWSLLHADRYPWLAGLGVALAFNAKQSALALLPVGVLAVVWLTENGNLVNSANTRVTNKSKGDSKENPMLLRVHSHSRWIKSIRNLGLFLSVFGLVTIALNPLYWRNPVKAAQASLAIRLDLLSRQVAVTERLASDQVLDTHTQRFAVILGQLYVLPLQFFEIGNYRTQTASAEQAYLAVPGHNLLRGLVGGGILLMFTLMGLINGFLDIEFRRIVWSRGIILLLVSWGLMGIGLLTAVPLPYQRYSMPLLPLTVVWMGIGIRKNKSPLD